MFQSEIARLKKLGVQGVSVYKSYKDTIATDIHLLPGQPKEDGLILDVASVSQNTIRQPANRIAPLPSSQLLIGHSIRTHDVEGVMSVYEFRITHCCCPIVSCSHSSKVRSN